MCSEWKNAMNWNCHFKFPHTFIVWAVSILCIVSPTMPYAPTFFFIWKQGSYNAKLTQFIRMVCELFMILSFSIVSDIAMNLFCKWSAWKCLVILLLHNFRRWQFWRVCICAFAHCSNAIVAHIIAYCSYRHACKLNEDIFCSQSQLGNCDWKWCSRTPLNFMGFNIIQCAGFYTVLFICFVFYELKSFINHFANDFLFNGHGYIQFIHFLYVKTHHSLKIYRVIFDAV